MPIGVTLNKDRVEHLLKCFHSGKSITPPTTGPEILMLLGTCFAILMTNPAYLLEASGRKGVPTDSEHSEAVYDSVVSDLHGAIEFLGRLVAQVMDGSYDSQYEPYFQAIVSFQDGKRSVTPIRGLKKGDA